MDENLKEQFVKRNKLAICATLRELKKNDTTVMVFHSRGQFISKVLDVQPDNDIFLFDLGGLEQENSRALFAGELDFLAEPAGAKIEFKSHITRTMMYEGLPAFCADIPSELYYIQRRNFFRITSPAWPPMVCRGTLSDKSQFQFTVKDLSLGGVCLYTERDDIDTLINPGDVIKNAEIDLNNYGHFTLDLELVGHVTTKLVSNKGEIKKMQRLSFRFPQLTSLEERELQQVIVELELEQSNKRKRFQ
ncbi:flagellar brake protein [Brenneria uluponensis]|uniref:flagellar brake protein n=1 Tax=Brenneria uluponensis TaxID=3057057 RepID=UPI0028EB212A|nr:flagellar regulator YcgR PilZN domain-containing protein [Brenneria ulupoensis]